MIFVKLLLLVAQAIILITHTSADSIQPPSTQRAKSLQYNDRTRSHRRNGSYYHDLDVCGSPVLARSKVPVPADQAAHIWETDHICAPAKYWRLTPGTMRESGAQAFFLDWFEAYRLGKYEGECDGARMTAIQCFASMWWGDFDFQCTIDQIERCAVPTTPRITTWIQGRYNWPPAQVTETARKVLFIYKHFQIAISDLKTDWDVISRMGSAVALEAHFAVDNFTPQHNSVTQAYCDVAKAVSEIAVDMALQSGVVGVNLGQFTGSFRAMSKAADDLMATAHKTKDYREAVFAAQKLNMARQSMYYTQWATGEARKAAHAAQEVTDAYQHAKGSVIPEREKPRLEFPLIKGYGPCGNIFGVIDDNTHSQVDQLVLFINQHLHGLRYAVEELFNSFFIKDHEDLGDIALQDVMKINNWPGVSTRSYEGLEVTVKAAIKNLIISELLAASRQYLKCEERDDAAEACEQDKALQFTIRRGLYCPPDHPKLRCQAGRITKKQILNHDKDLIALQGGSDKFASNGIDLFELYSNSLERYFVMGTDSYSPRGLYIRGNVVDPSKMAYLPVTVSKVKTVHPGELHMNFPYSCGDWTSNCTAAFLDRVNVDIQHEWEMRTTILTHHLKLIHEPANRFLLLCNLGLRMPHSGGDITTQVVRLDPSPICKRVKNAIQDKDELEGNYRFCTLDVVREYAFKHERVGTIGGLHSHKVLCQKWIFANNLEIEKRFESVSV